MTLTGEQEEVDRMKITIVGRLHSKRIVSRTQLPRISLN